MDNCLRCNNTGKCPSGVNVGSSVVNMPCPKCRKEDFDFWWKMSPESAYLSHVKPETLNKTPYSSNFD